MKLKFYLRGLGIGMVVTALLMGIAGRTTVTMTDEQIKAKAAELGMVDETDKVLTENDSLNPVSATSIGNVADSDVQEIPTLVIPPTGTESDEAEDGQAPRTDAASSASSDEAEDGQAPRTDAASSAFDASKEKSSSSTTDKENTKSSSSSSDKEKAKSSSSSSDKDKDKISSSSTDAEKAKSSSSSSEKGKAPQVSEDGKTVTIVISSGQSSSSVARACAEAGLIEDADSFDEFLCANGYDRKITTGRKTIPVGASPVEIAGIITVK